VGAALALLLGALVSVHLDAAERERLAGHDVAADDTGGYLIRDVAGEGPPLVGVVERRGPDLWLRDGRGGAVRLAGPLAHPRIAGPGYRVWVVGREGADGGYWVRRLGVLSAP
jgi:hypothetical protein